ncbi:MAG: hypothetical protein M0R33_06730 [Methylomonas sp.]|jgi:hypothetical protein|uniref:hypothetical protein n=1 Tax=Methylomonas sp. TaxID=418 RepID=UPI0025CBD9C6|nr:hypothetical protein [Methylomonas sp.]MCK9606133.1 hypothetical protein [Methylomonas sp.]
MTTCSFAKPEGVIYLSSGIGIVAFQDVGILDNTGPFEAFNFANLGLFRKAITEKNTYTGKMLAETPGPTATLSELHVIAEHQPNH